ncbi:sensor histidine kinase [Aestuariibaculum sediminum]|uniref:Histidine kinase n=1 Tax=Aestuariibaculum sediminum TaxID=2770637 RepID=A0A8J6UC03_9FLAO|nr:histidine kinase [Aestuariibaculum sediminum]MBD0831749.1 histidine kinase [Aestuariibaculum sediminum]
MLKKIVLQKLAHFGLHIIFWCAVLLFYTYFFGFNSNDFGYVFSFSSFLMPITIATTYVFIYKLIPDYLVTKHYKRFTLYSFYTIIISNYLIVISVFYGLVYLSNFQYSNMAPISRSLIFVATAVYMVVIIVSAFKLLKLNLSQAKKTKKLETKFLESQLKMKEQELHYLKMQIHPHFLFNTLNTLYGFALKKADEAPEMILKLSNLLDYLLYKVDKPFVLLSDEVNHIQDYLELENMRFNKTLNIDFKVDNVSNELKIAPMLLLPFVENSFKHGAIKSGKLNIKMRLSCKANTLYFYIENSQNKTEFNKEEGIGLKNIKKRLDLTYKDNYTFNIKNEASVFKVDLIINLN